jgi:ferredoxin
MTFVIAEPCIGTKDTACVDVCPVDCIHPTKDDATFENSEMLFIDPEECIDCGACEPACPVEAIFEEDAVPDKWKEGRENPCQQERAAPCGALSFRGSKRSDGRLLN